IAVAGLIGDRVAPSTSPSAVEKCLLLGLVELSPGFSRWNLVRLRHAEQQSHRSGVGCGGPGILTDSTLLKRQISVRHNQRRIDLQTHAESLTGGTRAMWIVEAECAWLDLWQRNVSIYAGQF